ncbi:helix-turn-helix transcriptional regulator [Streptomyces griseorubiginosus]|uniref:helix-turn-helix transcriptional regulator n=1 Tax=Streptomyces griseorubiginosus TaxID=67304 RepID=UPI00363755B0
MVEPAPKGETLREIANRHGRAYNTLRNQWARHPDWPDPLPEKRGRSLLYDPADVDRVIAQHFARSTTELEPRRLYTAKEIEQATGIKTTTIRADRSTGRWPAPDDTSSRAHRWYGATITTTLKNRRSYGSTTSATNPE